MRLELDAGNTRIKWRVSKQGVAVASGSNLKVELEQVQAETFDEVWVSSVHQQQNEWIRSVFPQAQFAQTDVLKAGLHNSYEDVSRMGVDRWLAMLAAYYSAPNKSHIIIDAGTALTLDVIEQGRHQGGFICPGLSMMKHSILGNTQQVKAEHEWLLGRQPGCSTQAGLDHGILDMACSWIENHIAARPDAICWLTGGDAERLQPLLNRSLVLESDLVLNGLHIHFSK